MANWRCPHCGTPQAESARCWACSRSPLSCSTCRSFRRSVAAKIGYCAVDRTRQALTGDEIRPCWQSPSSFAEPLIGLFGGLTADAHPMAAVAQRPAPELPRWRHAAVDAHGSTPAATPVDAPTRRRSSGLALLPATLANRLRRNTTTRGPRDLRPNPVQDGGVRAAAPSPLAPPPIATVRPARVGRLVDAPQVPPSGGTSSLGDQLRRAEQIRRARALRERELLDGERLRGGGGSDPVA